MARFSAPAVPAVGARKVTNDAGGDAFDRDPKTALASLVLTSMVQDTFYKSAEAGLADVRALCAALAAQNGLAFVAKTALYARHVHGLRSISHALAGEVGQLRGGHPEQRGDWGTRFFDRIVYRADDASQIIAYWISNYATAGKPKTVPNAMKRGLARAMQRTKPHLLAKWQSGEPSLRQVGHLVHPKGEKDSAIYRLRGGVLESADTHEVALSKAGQSEGDVGAAKAEAWGRLFAENKVGYLAALRNCRNVLASAPDAVPALCAKLRNPDDVRGSKVFPHQFLAAHAEVGAIQGPQAREVLAAIEDGADLAVSNVPKLPGATLVALDDSGSMTTGNAHVKGALFASAIARANADCDVMLFSDGARYVTLSPRATLFGSIRELVAKFKSSGTNYHAIFQTASRAYDRIVILSDAQGWMGYNAPDASLYAYQAMKGCKPAVYAWDLVGSKTAMFPEKRIFALAGISDRVFDLMGLCEQDPRAMVNAIEATEL